MVHGKWLVAGTKLSALIFFCLPLGVQDIKAQAYFGIGRTIGGDGCVPGKITDRSGEAMLGSGGVGLVAGDPTIFIISMSVSSTTNVSSFFTAGTAVTSETSGCGDETAVYRQQQHFVAVTIDSLSQDMARGHGPHLQSMAALLGCPTSVYPDFANVTQKKYEQLFPSTEIEPTAFLDRLKDEISNHPQLSVSCVYI